MKIYCFDYDLWTFSVQSYKLESPYFSPPSSSSRSLLFDYHFIVGFDNLKKSFVFFLQTSFKRPSPEPFENEILKSTAKKGGKAAATKATKKKKRDPNEPQK